MISLVTYHTDSAIRSALVKRGHKWMQVVAIDATSTSGLKVWRVPMSDEKYMTPLLRKGKPYPMTRALRTFRNMAKTHGCSKAAKKLITEAANEDKTAKANAASPGDSS